MIKAVVRRRYRVKEMAVNYKGGKCQICGYCRYIGALELHHAFGKKEFGISEKGYTRSWEKIQIEIGKCVLLCANCHREVGGGVTKLPKVILRGSAV